MCKADEERLVREQQQQEQQEQKRRLATMDKSFVPYRLAGEYLTKRIAETDGRVAMPVVGIICGSGLSGLSATLQETLTIPYKDIPGFPAHCTVAGHKGELVLGKIVADDKSGTQVPCICFRGRFHSYEGHDMKTVVLPVYVMRCLSTVRTVIITNAAGGLNASYNVGDVVAVSDHLALPQLAGKNALIGPNDDELGPRFPATSNAYPDGLRRLAQRAAQDLKFDKFFRASHATYCFVSGPMYESKAECRLLASLGGDAVGMSTVPEVVAAHHCDLQVLCLSLITNKVVMKGDEGEAVASHAEVLEAVAQRSVQMQALVRRIVVLMHEQVLPKLPPLRQVSLIVPEHLKRQHTREQQEQEAELQKANAEWWLLNSDDGDDGTTTTDSYGSNKKPFYQDTRVQAFGAASLIFAAGLFVGARTKRC